MNRRRFLELLGSAALGSGIVYSFPSVIVPRNISIPTYEEVKEAYDLAKVGNGEWFYYLNTKDFMFVESRDHRFEFENKIISDDKVLFTIKEINPPILVKRINF